jgi:CRP-like cAMP-binding protein
MPAPIPAGAMPLGIADISHAVSLLRDGVMFRRCSTPDLEGLAATMHARTYAKGDDIVTQGAPSSHFYLLAAGDVLRLRTDPDGTAHHVDAARFSATTINALHVLGSEPVFSSARCESKQCRAFGIDRATFAAHLSRNPELAASIIDSLSADARRKSKIFRTPLLQQQTPVVNYSAITIGTLLSSSSFKCQSVIPSRSRNRKLTHLFIVYRSHFSSHPLDQLPLSRVTTAAHLTQSLTTG